MRDERFHTLTTLFESEAGANDYLYQFDKFVADRIIEGYLEALSMVTATSHHEPAVGEGTAQFRGGS